MPKRPSKTVSDQDQALTDIRILIPSLMQELTAVTLAQVDKDGRLIECNRGFRLLIGSDGSQEAVDNIRHLFVRPSFADLLALSDTPQSVVYQGIMNLGRVDSQVSSITGAVYCNGQGLLLVGEHDVLDLQRLTATVIELNEELAEKQRELVRANQALKRNEVHINRLILTDPLTGVPNRRHFNEQAAIELDRAQRYASPLSLCIADVDHFKQVNDRYGHSTGDAVLREFAILLQSNLRSSDFLARIGGEEFIIVLPYTGLDEGQQVVEKLRRMLSQHVFQNLERPVTASFGIAAFDPQDDVDSLLHHADLALYRSKASGRNRVTRWVQATQDQ